MQEYFKSERTVKRIIHAAAIILSVIFLFIGNRLTQREPIFAQYGGSTRYFTAVVTEITRREAVNIAFSWDSPRPGISIDFYARVTSGARRGDIVHANQELYDGFMFDYPEITLGDRVMIVHDAFNNLYFFNGFARFSYALILGVVLFAAIIAFARFKGLNAIVALAFTCLAVFFIFVPAILTGRNIYVATLIVSVYAIVSTLVIVIGANKKALSAMLGCLGGVLTAATLMLVVSRVANLLGFFGNNRSLLHLPLDSYIDLQALVFAGVILGAVGAIMDVAMSIASSLWELREAGGVTDFRSIFTSGVNIGKDILGTMLNTLILAYIGSSLTLILLIAAFTTSYTALLNEELIVVEFFRAIVGSFGMLLTIPLTAAVCGWLYGTPSALANRADDDAVFYEEY